MCPRAVRSYPPCRCVASRSLEPRSSRRPVLVGRVRPELVRRRGNVRSRRRRPRERRRRHAPRGRRRQYRRHARRAWSGASRQLLRSHRRDAHRRDDRERGVRGVRELTSELRRTRRLCELRGVASRASVRRDQRRPHLWMPGPWQSRRLPGWIGVPGLAVRDGVRLAAPLQWRLLFGRRERILRRNVRRRRSLPGERLHVTAPFRQSSSRGSCTRAQRSGTTTPPLTAVLAAYPMALRCPKSEPFSRRPRERT